MNALVKLHVRQKGKKIRTEVAHVRRKILNVQLTASVELIQNLARIGYVLSTKFVQNGQGMDFVG